MNDLLQHYTLDEIVIFIVLLAFAIKGIVDFYTWGKNHIQSLTNRDFQRKTDKASIKSDIDKLFDIQVVQNEAIEKLTKSVNLLLSSDKDEIKAWITEKHHYFCYEVKYIDDYSLDCIERRYAHYKEEGGNSFIADLMEDLRALPKVSSTVVKISRDSNIK